MKNSRHQLHESSLSRVYQHIDSSRSWAIISAWRDDMSDDEKDAATESLKRDLSGLRHGYFPVKGRWKEEEGDSKESEKAGIENIIHELLGDKVIDIEWSADNAIDIDIDQSATLREINDLRKLIKGDVDIHGETDSVSIVLSYDVGKKVDVWEQSFFVVNIKRSEIVALCRKYNQEGVVFGEPSLLDHITNPEDLHRVSDGPSILLLGPHDNVIKVISKNNKRGFHPNKISDAYSSVKGRAFSLSEGRISHLNILKMIDRFTR